MKQLEIYENFEKNMKISFSESKNQGLFGAEHEKNRQKIKKQFKKSKK